MYVVSRGPDHPGQVQAVPCPACQAQRTAARLAQLLGPLADATFASFVVRRAPATFAPLVWDGRSYGPADQLALLNLAAQALRQLSPASWALLQGPPGSGKSHLAVATARSLAGPAGIFAYWRARALLDHLQDGFEDRGHGATERLEAVCAAPILVIDDLGSETPSAWRRERMGRLLDERYCAHARAQRTTIITTNLSLDDLTDRYGADIVSRILAYADPLPVVASDYRRARAPGQAPAVAWAAGAPPAR